MVDGIGRSGQLVFRFITGSPSGWPWAVQQWVGAAMAEELVTG